MNKRRHKSSLGHSRQVAERQDTLDRRNQRAIRFGPQILPEFLMRTAKGVLEEKKGKVYAQMCGWSFGVLFLSLSFRRWGYMVLHTRARHDYIHRGSRRGETAPEIVIAHGPTLHSSQASSLSFTLARILTVSDCMFREIRITI